MVLRGWDVRVAAIGVLIAVLAGCTSDPEPQLSPTPTPTPAETVVASPSPTPSPSPTELTEEEILAAIPERAHVEDFPGAQTFVEFYVQLFPELFRSTARPHLFSALSTPECTFCSSAIENAAGAREEGLQTTGGEISFPESLAQGGQGADGDWLIEHSYTESAIEYLDSGGNVVETAPEQSGTVVALLTFDGDRWTVRNLAFEYHNDD